MRWFKMMSPAALLKRSRFDCFRLIYNNCPMMAVKNIKLKTQAIHMPNVLTRLFISILSGLWPMCEAQE